MRRYDVADVGDALVDDDLEDTLEGLEDSFAVKSYGGETLDVAGRDVNLDEFFKDDLPTWRFSLLVDDDLEGVEDAFDDDSNSLG